MNKNSVIWLCLICLVGCAQEQNQPKGEPASNNMAQLNNDTGNNDTGNNDTGNNDTGTNEGTPAGPDPAAPSQPESCGQPLLANKPDFLLFRQQEHHVQALLTDKEERTHAFYITDGVLQHHVEDAQGNSEFSPVVASVDSMDAGIDLWGRPHVLYRTSKDQTIYHACLHDGVWAGTAVPKTQKSSYFSLALSPQGIVFAVYADVDDYTIKVGKKGQGQWLTQPIRKLSGTLDLPRSITARFLKDEQLGILYDRRQGIESNWSHRSEGLWTHTPLHDPSARTMFAAQLHLDPQGGAHILSQDSYTPSTELSSWTGQAWEVERVAQIEETDLRRRITMSSTEDGTFFAFFQKDGVLNVAKREADAQSWTTQALPERPHEGLIAANRGTNVWLAYVGQDYAVASSEDEFQTLQIKRALTGPKGPQAFAFDPQGRGHLVMTRQPDDALEYVMWDDRIIERTLLDGGASGLAPAISVDDQGTVYVSHYDQAQQALKLSIKRQGTWSTEVVSMQQSQSNAQLAVVDHDHVVMAYKDRLTRRLVVAQRRNGAWTMTPVDTDHAPVDFSLTVDAQGTPHVAYSASGLGVFYGVQASDGTWSTHLLEAIMSTRGSMDILVTSSNAVHISYRQNQGIDGSFADIDYMHWTNETGDWVRGYIDDKMVINGYGTPTTELLEVSPGDIQVFYYDTSEREVRRARRVSGRWNTSTLEDSSGHTFGQAFDADIDPSGTLWVSSAYTVLSKLSLTVVPIP